MLDGRIDAQGTVQELRARGVLDEIAHEAAVEVKKEEQALPVDVVDSATLIDQTEAKKPRKLVEDEHRGEFSIPSHHFAFRSSQGPQRPGV